MATDHFLIKLKNFSINTIYCTLSIALVACSQQSQVAIRKPFPYSAPSTSSTAKSMEPKTIDKAPWEVWEVQDFGNENLKLSNRLIKDGQLDQALSKYQESLSSLQSSEQAEYALMNICSTYLKKDKPNECLNLITKYANKRGLHAGQLDSRFSLLAGYAYLRVRDINQTLAWFSQAFKAASGAGAVAQESRNASRVIMRQQGQDSLTSLSSKWSSDTFVASLITEEKERRLKGGVPVKSDIFAEFYEAKRYSTPELPQSLPNDINGTSEHGEVPDSNVQAPLAQELNDISKLRVGALLPFSGTYSQYSNKVIRGIELALEQNGVSTEIAKIDSNSINSSIAYQSLVNDYHVNVVFGPLLVKDAEEVASISASLKIPTITFAKKRGLPESSVALYRLGATAENQLSEIVRIAGEHSKLVLLIPEDELGVEFKDAAQAIQSRSNSEVFTTIHYSNNSFDSVGKAILTTSKINPDGIIVVDSPNKLEPLIREIKSNPELQGKQLYGSAITADFKHLGSYLNLLDGMKLVTFFNPTSKKYVVTKFIDDYKNRFNEMPDLLAAQSYDATQFALNAFKMNTGNELEILSELNQIDGVTGTIINSPSRDLQRITRSITIRSKNIIEE